jgi:hypothetical protein
MQKMRKTFSDTPLNPSGILTKLSGWRVSRKPTTSSDKTHHGDIHATIRIKGRSDA